MALKHTQASPNCDQEYEGGCRYDGRRTAGGVVTQASLYGVHECWRKSRRQGGRFRSLTGPRKALGESLNHGYTETPDVAGRGGHGVFCFRRIVQGRFSDDRPGFAGGTDGIARQFQLIIDHQKVCRLQPALHQVSAVKESQGIQGGDEHFPHFVGSQGPVRKDLRESLFGIFHYDEEKLVTPELALTCVEKPNQIGMGESGSRHPVRELCLGQCPLSRDELDRGSRHVLCLTFSKEYRAVV